jgi:putative endonuclease
MARHNEIGHIGEEAVESLLRRNGHHILDKNYRTNTGELDLVTSKNGVIHFVEVKSAGLRDSSEHMPEDNVTKAKQKKMSKTIQIYLMEKGLTDSEFVIDIAAVFVDPVTEKSSIRMLEAITFGY